jgi:hypothetical protein
LPQALLLLSLDETTLRSRSEVLSKEVAVADAELLAASQRAFDNPQSKNELTLLEGRAQQRRAELAAVQAQLQRTQVLAPRPGVAVFSDPNDWLGKPVVTGERIMQVADPAQPAMQIQLAVADAIALEPGAEVTLFLTAYPLSPLKGKILETSYQARPSEEGVVAYRLLASVEDQPEHARLGLHGTAKLYSGRVMLGYYLLRRPCHLARMERLVMQDPADQPLPPLREDLRLDEAAKSSSGEPAWMIQDTVLNRFYRIGWLEFECLLRWGQTPRRISEQIAKDTRSSPMWSRSSTFASFSNSISCCAPAQHSWRACRPRARSAPGPAGAGGCTTICSSASRCCIPRHACSGWPGLGLAVPSADRRTGDGAEPAGRDPGHEAMGQLHPCRGRVLFHRRPVQFCPGPDRRQDPA